MDESVLPACSQAEKHWMLAMVKKQKAKLPKELQKPIRWTGPVPRHLVQNAIEPDDYFAERKRRVEQECEIANYALFNERLRRLKILAQHLGIDSNKPAWEFCLSLRLAKMAYRGFDVEYEVQNGDPRFGTVRDIFYL